MACFGFIANNNCKITFCNIVTYPFSRLRICEYDIRYGLSWEQCFGYLVRDLPNYVRFMKINSQSLNFFCTKNHYSPPSIYHLIYVFSGYQENSCRTMFCSKCLPLRTCFDNLTWLMHWGRETQICVSKLKIIGSCNGLLPGQRQAIIWTNDGVFLIDF